MTNPHQSNSFFNLADTSVRAIGPTRGVLLENKGNPLTSPRGTVANRTELHKTTLNAALSGQSKALKKALKKVKKDINKQDSFGMTPLHYAILQDNDPYSIVKELLPHKPNLSITNNKNHTVFHIAAARNQPALLQLLLDQHKNLSHIPKGKELIRIALGHQAFSNLKLLLEANADSSQLKALPQGQWWELLKKIASQNTPECFELIDYLVKHFSEHTAFKKGMSILHIAASLCNPPMVKFFLEQGEDPNTTGAFNMTALYFAILFQGKEKEPKIQDLEGVVKCLLQAGTNPDLRDTEEDRGVLYEAIKHNFHSIVALLLQYGADPNVVDDLGLTPLYSAITFNFEPIVELLLRCGTNPYAVDIQGSTPLWTAVSIGRSIKIVKQLLARGADINQMKGSETLLHQAVITNYSIHSLLESQGDLELGKSTLEDLKGCRKMIVEHLLKKGLNPNARTLDGSTPLHHAAAHGKKGKLITHIIHLLHLYGADLEAKTNDGKTPIDIAPNELKSYLSEIFDDLRNNTPSPKRLSP